MLTFSVREVIKMKKLLWVAMMALASLFFIANGASAQYCSSFLPSCHYQLKAGITGEQANEEMSPATSGAQNGNVEFAPAVQGQKQVYGEFMPAGSSSHREYMTPKNAPYEAPAENQSY
jgi:hypothetical protein